MNGFRTLRAEEIDCRVATVSEKGVSLLLYKDARCDQNMLDEKFGMFGWKRSHQLIGDRLYCTVEVKNPETGEWIAKQDVGTESYTEKEKGQASDSFKRACFNLGIGRELYTAPFIWIRPEGVNLMQYNGKYTTRDRFEVVDIDYRDGYISTLVIANMNKGGDIVYKYGLRNDNGSNQSGGTNTNRNNKNANTATTEPSEGKATESQLKALSELTKKTGFDTRTYLARANLKSFKDMSEQAMKGLLEALQRKLQKIEQQTA